MLGISTLIMVLQFAIFSYALFEKIHGNFSQDAIHKAVSDRGDIVIPLASRLLIETGQNSLPAYRDAIVAAIHQRGPELATETVNRFEEIPQQSGKELQDKLQATFADVMQRIEPEFKTAFPNLSDERRQELVQAFLADEIDSQNKRIAERINGLYTGDLTRMQDVLEKFDLPDPSVPQDQNNLERDFLHTMVALVDDQLDASYGKSATMIETGAPASGLAPGKLPSTQPAAQATAQ